MQHRSRWIGWPWGAIRTGVVALVALTALVVVFQLPGLIRDLEETAASNSALSYAHREVAGGNALVVDQAAVYAARSLIPEDEPYHVSVGAGYGAGTELTVPHLESYYAYFLVPRRPAGDARWIVCYGCDADDRPGAEVLWRGESDISIVRIPA